MQSGLPQRISDEETKKLTLGVSASSWSGDFGAPIDTDVNAVLFTARYKLGNLRLNASVPWMRIDTPGAVFTGISGTPLLVSPIIQSQRTTRDGLGDLTLGASYLVPARNVLGVDLDVSAQLKLPTATDNLSTGEVDYSLGAEVSRSFGRFYPFASVTYRGFGDTEVLRLNDGFAASMGAGYLVGRQALVMLSYDYAERASRFIPDSHEVVASFSSRVGSTPVRFSSFVAGGLSKGAADLSGGVSLSLDF